MFAKRVRKQQVEFTTEEVHKYRELVLASGFLYILATTVVYLLFVLSHAVLGAYYGHEPTLYFLDVVYSNNESWSRWQTYITFSSGAVVCLLIAIVSFIAYRKVRHGLTRLFFFWFWLAALVRVFTSVLEGFIPKEDYLGLVLQFFILHDRDQAKIISWTVAAVLLLIIGIILRRSLLRFTNDFKFIGQGQQRNFVAVVFLLPWLAGLVFFVILGLPELPGQALLTHALLGVPFINAWLMVGNLKMRKSDRYLQHNDYALDRKVVIYTILGFFVFRHLVFNGLQIG